MSEGGLCVYQILLVLGNIREGEMGFITYRNLANPHVTIHRDWCSQIKKRGGIHKYGQGDYHTHKTFDDAAEFAKSSNLKIIKCSYCRPQIE